MSILSDRVLNLISYLDDNLFSRLAEGILAPAERLSLVAHGDGDQVGAWEAVTDPEVAEVWALPYAAQWCGATMPIRRPGETDPEFQARARLEIEHPRGMWRGGALSLRTIARTFLTGNKTVRVYERPSGELWYVTVFVKSEECPDQAALVAGLNDPEILPAGFIITVEFDDSPVVDEGTIPIDTTDGTVTIDDATLADVTTEAFHLYPSDTLYPSGTLYPV